MNLALYLIYGPEHYAAEAISSARSLRKHAPDLPIWTFTDQQLPDNVFDRRIPLVEHCQPPLLTKAHALANTGLPDAANVLFLDADTHVLADLRPLFGLLQRFDLVLTHALDNESGYYRLPLPTGFQEYSTGVMLYRQDRVYQSFQTWYSRYRDDAAFYGNNDQPALTEVIYQSDLRVHVLPPAYNVRVGSAHILHGHNQL